MIYLVVGECSGCIDKGNIIMRQAGLIKDQDYYEVNRFEKKDSSLFKADPTLYTHALACAWNDSTGKYVVIKPNNIVVSRGNYIKPGIGTVTTKELVDAVKSIL
jgi:hypothetical protein